MQFWLVALWTSLVFDCGLVWANNSENPPSNQIPQPPEGAAASRDDLAPYTEGEMTVNGMHISRRNFIELNSTHAYSAQKFLIDPKKPKEWVLVTAGRQTAGVSGPDTEWVSWFSGNIYMSLSFPYEVESLKAQYFNAPIRKSITPFLQIATLATFSVLQNHFPEEKVRELSIQWPDCILCRGETVAGIMAEITRFEGLEPSNMAQCTISVGINLNMSPKGVKSFHYPVTSLSSEVGQVLDEECILNELLKSIIDFMTQYDSDGTSFSADFYKHLAFTDSLVKVKNYENGKYVQGEIIGIDKYGSIQVRDPITREITIVSRGRLYDIPAQDNKR